MKLKKLAGIILLWYIVRFLCENVLCTSGWGILFFRCIYHPLCLSMGYRQIRHHYYSGRGVIIRYSLFLAVYALCYAFYLPDRIDFFMAKIAGLDKMLEEDKKLRGTWDESDDVTIVASCYITDYPDRVPLIADKKKIVYGPYRKLLEHYGRKPQSKLVHMYGNWYYWYYENNEMPG